MNFSCYRMLTVKKTDWHYASKVSCNSCLDVGSNVSYILLRALLKEKERKELNVNELEFTPGSIFCFGSVAESCD